MRYAAMVMGEYPVVVDVTAPDIAELRDFLVHGPWESLVESVHATLLIQTFKRGGVVTPSAEMKGPQCLWHSSASSSSMNCQATQCERSRRKSWAAELQPTSTA